VEGVDIWVSESLEVTRTKHILGFLGLLLRVVLLLLASQKGILDILLPFAGSLLFPLILVFRGPSREGLADPCR
jgi:hypothetical protein